MHFHTQYIYIFSMILGVRSDCFPEAYTDVFLLYGDSMPKMTVELNLQT
jgi:radical SAM superfamily enzyme